jgi:hypothetical protein
LESGNCERFFGVDERDGGNNCEVRKILRFQILRGERGFIGGGNRLRNRGKRRTGKPERRNYWCDEGIEKRRKEERPDESSEFRDCYPVFDIALRIINKSPCHHTRRIQSDILWFFSGYINILECKRGARAKQRFLHRLSEYREATKVIPHSPLTPENDKCDSLLVNAD